MRVSVDSYKSQTLLRGEIGERVISMVCFVLFSSDGSVLCFVFQKLFSPSVPTHDTSFDDCLDHQPHMLFLLLGCLFHPSNVTTV